jgi:16S rRNA (guanine966-N2)-methyltransferase
MTSTPSRPAAGKLRIIGGSLRGSKLAVPDVLGLRPTSDRVRETLFNWLMPVIDGARCLDLFAGTGALGIEALSRGAAWTDFVESDARLAQSLRENLQRLKQTQASVRGGDAATLLRMPPPSPYDIVFVDPPFSAAFWEPIAHTLEAQGWRRRVRLSGDACAFASGFAGSVGFAPRIHCRRRALRALPPPQRIR